MAESFKVESVVWGIPRLQGCMVRCICNNITISTKRFKLQDRYTVAVIKYDAVIAPFTHLSTLKDLNSTILLMPKVNILRVKFLGMANDA